jgi:hypothetical protein
MQKITGCFTFGAAVANNCNIGFTVGLSTGGTDSINDLTFTILEGTVVGIEY